MDYLDVGYLASWYLEIFQRSIIDSTLINSTLIKEHNMQGLKSSKFIETCSMAQNTVYLEIFYKH